MSYKNEGGALKLKKKWLIEMKHAFDSGVDILFSPLGGARI